MNRFDSFARTALFTVIAIVVFLTMSCSTTMFALKGGSRELREEARPPRSGPHVLIFAFDGGGYDQVMEAIRSGKAPRMQSLLGREGNDGVFEHGYSAPNAISILPSTTVAAWASIFTGAGPAYTGVPGNEWFTRPEMHFYAPVPVSVRETDDNKRAITEDLVGKAILTPTLFELVDGPSDVSLNFVQRGADLFTTIDPSAMVTVMGRWVNSELGGNEAKQTLYAHLDIDSTPKVIENLTARGVPNVQVVYMPGIDLYAHLAENPLQDEVNYLETVTDPLVGAILDTYQKLGALDDTYVLFVADHGHTPVLKDEDHALGAKPDLRAPGLLKAAGFRVRKLQLEIPESDQDYQSVLAYQGAIAYVYLADRSTCRDPGTKCDWSRPPRFQEDVMPVARAFYEANRKGKPVPGLKGTLDLIFTRHPEAPAKGGQPFEVFDGTKLIPVAEYLTEHSRPDLIDLDRRLRWLAAGPDGDRAGDVLLLAKSGLNRPIEERFYFSEPYRSWHGSASPQDSHVPIIVASQDAAGTSMRDLVLRVAGASPSQLDIVPIVRALLKRKVPPLSTAVASPH
jgi:type I phosphodiesterase/nucleotide pyrophosphatase